MRSSTSSRSSRPRTKRIAAGEVECTNEENTGVIAEVEAHEGAGEVAGEAAVVEVEVVVVVVVVAAEEEELEEEEQLSVPSIKGNERTGVFMVVVGSHCAP